MEQIEQKQQEGLWQQRWSAVKIEQAICELRLLLEPLRRQQNYLPAPGAFDSSDRPSKDFSKHLRLIA